MTNWKPVLIAAAITLLAFAPASAFSAPTDDSQVNARVTALAKMLDAELVIFEIKSERVWQFREEMVTNILVFVLMGIGGAVMARAKLRIKRSLLRGKRIVFWFSIPALLVISFSGFGCFLSHGREQPDAEKSR